MIVLSEETRNKVLKSALEGMRVSLESGARFSEAASQHRELFPGYSVEILRSAELTGNLDGVLDQLSDYLEREIETKNKIKSAVAYPVIVIVLAVIVSTVLIVYVLPKFKNFFSSFNARLPLPTRILLDFAIGSEIGDGVGAWYSASFVAVAFLDPHSQGQGNQRQIILKLPLVGDLIHTAISSASVASSHR